MQTQEQQSFNQPSDNASNDELFADNSDEFDRIEQEYDYQNAQDSIATNDYLIDSYNENFNAIDSFNDQMRDNLYPQPVANEVNDSPENFDVANGQSEQSFDQNVIEFGAPNGDMPESLMPYTLEMLPDTDKDIMDNLSLLGQTVVKIEKNAELPTAVNTVVNLNVNSYIQNIAKELGDSVYAWQEGATTNEQFIDSIKELNERAEQLLTEQLGLQQPQPQPAPTPTPQQAATQSTSQNTEQSQSAEQATEQSAENDTYKPNFVLLDDEGNQIPWEKVVKDSLNEFFKPENKQKIQDELSSNPHSIFDNFDKYKNADFVVLDIDEVLSQKNAQGKTGFEQINEGLKDERINPAYMQMKNATANIFKTSTSFLHKIVDNTFGKLVRGIKSLGQSFSEGYQQGKIAAQERMAKAKEIVKENATNALKKSDRYANASFNKAENIIKTIREHLPNKAIVVTCAENTKANMTALAQTCKEQGILLVQKGTDEFKTLMEKPAQCYQKAKNLITSKVATQKAANKVNADIEAQLKEIQKAQQETNQRLDAIEKQIGQSKGKSH